MSTIAPTISPKPRKVTILDVARDVGVTTATVSYALNGTAKVAPATRANVLEAAERLGYEADFRAQQLRSGVSNTVVLFTLVLGQSAPLERIEALQKLLHEAGYSAPIHAYGHYIARETIDQKALLSDLRRQRPQAIVCRNSGLTIPALQELRRYQQEGGVLVMHDFPCDLECDRVVFDREASFYQAARYLLELGHRRIGLRVAAGPQTERLAGFQRALGEWGLQDNPAWHFGRETDDQNPEKMGAQLAEQLLLLWASRPAGERPTSLCIVNDQVAHACAVRLLHTGWQLPRDLSIIGYDNLPIAEYGYLPLTTLSHPVESIAKPVFELLQSRLDGSYSGPPREITVRGDLIIRQSTAAPPNE